jgi:hypothetical protein
LNHDNNHRQIVHPSTETGRYYETINGRCCIGECHRHSFYQNNENGTSVPHKVTDGLRVLGAPVGSTSFCNAFINKQSHAHNQTLQNWCKTLTTYKPPSAFSACARRTKSPTSSATQNTILDWRLEELPNKFLPWDSPMTTQFGAMTFSLLAHITNVNTLPPHAQLMANISINEGGLGIQTPRTNTITS